MNRTWKPPGKPFFSVLNITTPRDVRGGFPQGMAIRHDLTNNRRFNYPVQRSRGQAIFTPDKVPINNE